MLEANTVKVAVDRAPIPPGPGLTGREDVSNIAVRPGSLVDLPRVTVPVKPLRLSAPMDAVPERPRAAVMGVTGGAVRGVPVHSQKRKSDGETMTWTVTVWV